MNVEERRTTKMHHILCIAFLCLGATLVVEINCKAVINEVNIIDTGKPGTHEFVELKSTGETNLPLRGFKIVGISCSGKSGKVNLVVNLWNERMKSGFFTIGGSDVSNEDLKIPSDSIKFKSGFTDKKNVLSMSSFFVNDNKLSAIGLLYGEKNPFNEFKLTEKNREIVIDDKLKGVLKKSLVYLVIYGDRKACDKCDFFEMIHDDFANKKYTLRDFSKNIENNVISLNRCTLERYGFLPEKFKLGSLTPGKANDCSGPHFILEDNILEATPLVHSSIISEFDDLDSASDQPQCTSTIDISEYSQLSADSIVHAIDLANKTSQNDACTSMLLYPDGGNILQTVINANNRKRHISSAPDYSDENEWDTEKNFR